MTWWISQLTEIYKEYRETRKTYTYRATPANHKNMKSSKKALQELTENAKKHEKAFTSEYLDTARGSRQFWHILDKVTGKKNINIVEPLIKENNSHTFDDKEISDILKKNSFWQKCKQL